MKKVLLVLAAVLSFQASSFARSYSCVQKYERMYEQSYFDKLSGDTQDGLTVATGFSGVVIGMMVASSAFPAFLIASSIAASPILVGEGIKSIQNAPEKKMVKLIKQSYDYLEGEKAGRLLKRLQKQSPELDLDTLARSIVKGNEDLSLCEGLPKFKEVKESVRNGSAKLLTVE